MIVLLDTSEDLKVCEAELGCSVEQLLTPLTRFTPQYPESRFAIDNGAFSSFNSAGFLSLLEREKSRKALCRFVAVPDVVASARRTLEVFEYWKHIINPPSTQRWPLALVAQDGQEDLAIPWGEVDAIFIGGSTKFKLSYSAAAIIKAARAIGKWVHAGRVNEPARYEYFETLGADSIDGSGLARYSHMREAIFKAANNPNLFQQEARGRKP